MNDAPEHFELIARYLCGEEKEEDKIEFLSRAYYDQEFQHDLDVIQQIFLNPGKNFSGRKQYRSSFSRLRERLSNDDFVIE